MNEEKYLRRLAQEYPTSKAAACEIVNLTAIRQLPKGTEYFFSDLHGEYEGFLHLLRSASGMIRIKIQNLFENTLSEGEQNQLANLIYDPEKMLSVMREFHRDTDDWKKLTIFRLVQICKDVSSKYTRSKVRKKMPAEYAYILDELLHVNYDGNKKTYYNEIMHSMISVGEGDEFIIALCHLIQSLTVDTLHIIGDIFDRGPRPDIIMNELIAFREVDIQWGNHDISWMGAACGNRVLMANVVRMGISYNNFDCLEDGYGINLRALSSFASSVYREDPCTHFMPKVLDENEYDPVDLKLAAKMHKAITIIQFKLVGQLIERHPEYQVNNRNILRMIDYERGVVPFHGQEYPLVDRSFPTIDPKEPLKLTRGEIELMNAIEASFRHSEVLHRHIKFLYSNGSMYKRCNSNLLFHGCIPMKEDGSFDSLELDGVSYSGRALLDKLDQMVQEAYFLPEDAKNKQDRVDFMWYLWCGDHSPLFGKSKLSAFEHYFVADKSLQKEVMNPYYSLSEREEICDRIFREFELNPKTSHIINGHVPVKCKNGERPIKAGGKLYVIDGGISKAYQSKTGIAGYTLIFNSHYLALAEHHNYMSQEEITQKGAESSTGEGPGVSSSAGNDGTGMSGSADSTTGAASRFRTGASENAKRAPEVQITEHMPGRLKVADTDVGVQLLEQIEDLQELLRAYQDGRIKEQIRK